MHPSEIAAPHSRGIAKRMAATKVELSALENI
jgi:hypothetical protein